MKNKRGFLLGEETIKIIIAVICLVVLIFFLVSLYMANRNQELELAKASLEKLITDINFKIPETEIYNPKGWGIVSFSNAKGTIPNIPNFCLNKGWDNCICICSHPAGAVKTYLNSCNTKGVCQENDFSVQGEERLLIFEWGTDVIEIVPPLLLTINQQEKTITKKP